jgi:hypothetical protein
MKGHEHPIPMTHLDLNSITNNYIFLSEGMVGNHPSLIIAMPTLEIRIWQPCRINLMLEPKTSARVTIFKLGYNLTLFIQLAMILIFLVQY